jgi:hypothetical protein
MRRQTAAWQFARERARAWRHGKLLDVETEKLGGAGAMSRAQEPRLRQTYRSSVTLGKEYFPSSLPMT